jgi:hypothetical protein
MGIIIFYSVRFKVNPDNVATPIAAALGDLITLGILAGFGSFLYACMKSQVRADSINSFSSSASYFLSCIIAANFLSSFPHLN